MCVLSFSKIDPMSVSMKLVAAHGSPSALDMNRRLQALIGPVKLARAGSAPGGIATSQRAAENRDTARAGAAAAAAAAALAALEAAAGAEWAALVAQKAGVQAARNGARAVARAAAADAECAAFDAARAARAAARIRTGRATLRKASAGIPDPLHLPLPAVFPHAAAGGATGRGIRLAPLPGAAAGSTAAREWGQPLPPVLPPGLEVLAIELPVGGLPRRRGSGVARALQQGSTTARRTRRTSIQSHGARGGAPVPLPAPGTPAPAPRPKRVSARAFLRHLKHRLQRQQRQRTVAKTRAGHRVKKEEAAVQAFSPASLRMASAMSADYQNSRQITASHDALVRAIRATESRAASEQRVAEQEQRRGS
jgi:hypothetical protein